MDTQPICTGCHQPIRPEQQALTAVELISDQEFGGEPAEHGDGPTHYFHPEHFSQEARRYRVVARGVHLSGGRAPSW